MQTKTIYQRDLDVRLLYCLKTYAELNMKYLRAVTEENWEEVGSLLDAMDEEEKEAQLINLIKSALF